jgi:hypothetical protein
MVGFEISMGRYGDQSVNSGILSMCTDGREKDAAVSVGLWGKWFQRGAHIMGDN